MTNDKGLLRWAPVLAGCVLALSLLLAGWDYRRDHDAQQTVERERAVIVTSERLLSALKDVETGERGFIITGRDNYLEPYRWGTAA